MKPCVNPTTRLTIDQEAETLANMIYIRADWRTEDIQKEIAKAIRNFAAPKYL